MATGTVAVTGATGYVGGLVARRYAAAGWRVVALGRRPADGAAESRRFVLGERVEPGALQDVDVLVHCAYDMGLTHWRDILRVNVGGTALLLRAAVDAGVARPVLVSSMSAYAGTRQLYGCAKLRSEADVRASGGVAVRLGLVYDDAEPGGMAAALRRLAAAPVVPVIGARAHQFTVHAQDAAEGLLAVSSAGELPQVVGLAHPVPVPFARLLAALAGPGHRRRVMVPIPWRPVYAAMRVAELVGVALPVRADSVLGLVRPAPEVPAVETWAQLGVGLRPFPAATESAERPGRVSPRPLGTGGTR